MPDVVCLRPEEDFVNVGVAPPEALDIHYLSVDAPQLAAAILSAQAVVLPAVGPPLPADLFKGTSLKLVQVTGVGVDRLEIEALTAMGIPVANVPGGSDSAVAEYVVTVASALLRFLPESTGAIRTGNYAAFRKTAIARGLNQLDGLVVGLIGFGQIGQAVGARCRALGAKVVYFDPAVTDDVDGARSVGLDTLLATADIVTLHVPLVNATKGLIGARQIAQMKPSSVLINAARGGVVDEAALADALEQRTIAGAAVDVFSTEPPDPTKSLLTLSDAAASRLILTPHIAGVTRQSWARLFEASWRNVSDVLIDDQPPRNVVNGL